MTAKAIVATGIRLAAGVIFISFGTGKFTDHASEAASFVHYGVPLAGASVTAQRIDQGVDYSGSGTLSAIGDGKVIYVGTSGTGWPGAFVEYQLSGGAYAGRYVYYAESISPAAGLLVGQPVHAGQPIASINGGIEIGWGSGVGTQPLAQALGQWSGGNDSSNVPSASGKSFSAVIAQLGGPPGKVEG